MKFFKKSRKGFTLVELIVVIAIVAILAAVSVVSYIAFINKGNESADVQLVKQLNTCLQADEALNGKRVGARADYEDIENMLEENGFIVENLTKTKSGLDIVYQPDPVNRFALLDGNKLVYGESAYRPEDNAVMIWNADTKEEALAFVQAGKGVRLADGVGAIDEVNTSASFYVGNNSVGKINYTNNGDGQTVCFTTNGGDLVVNGKSDTVNHYAYLDNLTVEHVNSASYHEYGSVRLKMTVNDGHVVMEENSSVNELVIPETEEGNSVSIDIKDEADVESLVVNDAEATVVVGAEATVNEVVGETSNISGEGAQAAKQNEVEKTFVYNVATDEHLTLPQAIEQKKEYIVLAENINLSAVVLIDYSAKIDGQGYAIKSSANRVFRLSASDIVVNLRSVDIESTYTGGDSRAISIDSSLENITLLLNESSLKAKYYALNITGVNGSGSKNVKCYISNTRIEGYAAINNHASLAYFEVNNSVLIGNNQFIDSRPGEELKNYTMQEQYEYLVKAVKGSHVMQYGDLKIAKKSIYEFINAKSKKVFNLFKKGLKYILPPSLKTPTKIKINNENYRLEWFKMQAELFNDADAEAEYYEEIMAEGRVTKIFDIFNKKFDLGKRNYDDKVDFDCYRKVTKAYEKKCGTLLDRDFKFMTNIANFCTKGINPKKAAIAFKTICE